jgi:uncharacterized protein YajQ (UPF0234 family)
VPSMDVVNKLDMVEVLTAVDQARKEVIGRYDFKATNTAFDVDEKAKTITIRSNGDDRIAAAFEVMLGRMMKRNVSPKNLDSQKNEALPGGTVKRLVKLVDGIDEVNAKKVVAMIKEAHGKSCTASINGNLVRVSSKSRDSLQEVIAFLRGKEMSVPLQFTNFRD